MGPNGNTIPKQARPTSYPNKKPPRLLLFTPAHITELKSKEMKKDTTSKKWKMVEAAGIEPNQT